MIQYQQKLIPSLSNNTNFLTLKKTTKYISTVSSLTAIIVGLLFAFLSSCYKETEETPVASQQVVENRNGQGDLIFFRTSLSTDNYLVRNQNNTQPPREFTAYNHANIEQINFTSTDIGLANIGGVICNHYNVVIVYKDKTTEKFTAFSKQNGNSFTFKPTTSSLSASNPCNKIVWLDFGAPRESFNEYFGIKSLYNTWGIYCGSTRIGLKQKEPLNKNTKQFQLPGTH